MLLEADRYKPSILKANEQMLTHLKQQSPCLSEFSVIQVVVIQVSFSLTTGLHLLLKDVSTLLHLLFRARA